MDLESRWISNTSASTFYCWAEDPREASTHQDVFSMTVNQEMVNYFSRPDRNINTTSFAKIYCLNPLGDDDCPVGICPNPDIAGPLVRIANYITAFCLIILIFHAPKRVKDAFYYQLSTTYALLITCSISLFQASITRLHATIAIFIASSPVSLYFLVYSIRAFWSEHRLDTVLGRKNYLNRGLIFFAAGIWISTVIYTSLDSTQDRFSQGSCKTVTEQEIFGGNGLLGAPCIVIAALAALSWAISIALARKEIWSPGERYRPKFATVWKTVGRRFPLVFFISIGIFPMSVWIWTTEMTLFYMETLQPSVIPDTAWSFSFGQILALFTAVPPFLQVCELVPQLWSWVINLTWIACCWRRKRRGEQSVHSGKPDNSNVTLDYTGLPMLPEGRNSQFYGEMQEMQEATVRLEPNRYSELNRGRTW